jgi:hypothetical protein
VARQIVEELDQGNPESRAILESGAVEQSFQPDLFGRHDPCKARLAPAKTQVKTVLSLSKNPKNIK